MNDSSNVPDDRLDEQLDEHLDEMTGMLYVEGQLDRSRAQQVSAHAQDCPSCRTLLRALERESRLLTRAMLEEDEPFPSRLAAFQQSAQKSMQWIWGAVFGLAATGLYALYTGYVEPMQQRFEQAGFGGSSVLNLMIFQGAFWKGWQSMLTLLEVSALLTIAASGVVFLRRRMRRGTAFAMLVVGLCAAASMSSPVMATEFRSQGDTIEVEKNEIIKGDFFGHGHHVKIEGTVDGDVYVFCQGADIEGHVTGDVIAFAQMLRVTGKVDGNIRSFTNTTLLSGNVTKNLLSFAEIVTVDPAGKVGGSITTFVNTLTIDGSVGRDILAFVNETAIAGKIGGGIQAQGNTLKFNSGAQVDGPVKFKGSKPPEVSSGAKLAIPVVFTQEEHHKPIPGGRFLRLARDLDRRGHFIWFGTFLGSAQVCSRYGGLRRALWRLLWPRCVGFVWRAHRRFNRMYHRGWPAYWNFHVYPVAGRHVVCANRGWHYCGAMVDGSYPGDLAVDWPYGRRRHPCARRGNDSFPWRLGQICRAAVGYGCHFTGDLPPFHSCTRCRSCARIARYAPAAAT